MNSRVWGSVQANLSGRVHVVCQLPAVDEEKVSQPIVVGDSSAHGLNQLFL